MENNNLNVNDMMKLLSKMDKDQLEKGLTQFSKMLESSNASSLIEQIKKKTNQ